MQYAHRALDSRPRQGSLAPDAEPFVSRGQIHHQRTVDDRVGIEVVVIETIREFAEHRRVRQWNHATALTVREEYQAAGYYPVELGGLGLVGEWQECHRWCQDHIGRDHYSWTGSTFWFENQRDATLFAPRWSS
jgi:hypothetical protein